MVLFLNIGKDSTLILLNDGDMDLGMMQLRDSRS